MTQLSNPKIVLLQQIFDSIQWADNDCLLHADLCAKNLKVQKWILHIQGTKPATSSVLGDGKFV